ncbi:MAG: hypothetical protein IH595_07980 [Bacteroidales bacterium]|nr:hypothetical protein [Bacteroidales bacterium]
MKTLKIAFIALIVVLVNATGFAQSSVSNLKKTTENPTEVNVYYFHFNARCATCRAVESETQADVKKLFGNKVSFNAYNLDNEAGKAKGEELGVSGQTLLIVKGDKKINLTQQGFMYARTNPAKFRQILIDNIKPLL